MDHRGIAFTSLSRRQRPSTATANGRQRLKRLRTRPGSSMGLRRTSSPHGRNDVPEWMEKVVNSSPSLHPHKHPHPVISKRPWTSSSYRTTSHHERRLKRAMSHSLMGGPSLTSLSTSSSLLSSASFRGRRRSTNRKRQPRKVSEEMSIMSASVREPRSESDIVPRHEFVTGGSRTPVTPKDVFWTPSQEINISKNYFEGGMFQSLDVWGKLRMLEAEQVQLNVATSDSSYHARIAADTLLRVTRPCLFEHHLSRTIVNRMIKGMLLGTFGRTAPTFEDTIEGKRAEQEHHRKMHEHHHSHRTQRDKRTSHQTEKMSLKRPPQHDAIVRLSTVSEIMSSPSWIQAAIPLLERQAYEEQFLPQMEGWREAMEKNRQMEINALNRACKSWQK